MEGIFSPFQQLDSKTKEIYTNVFKYNAHLKNFKDPLRQDEYVVGGPFIMVRRGFDRIFEDYVDTHNPITCEMQQFLEVTKDHNIAEIQNIKTKQSMEYMVCDCSSNMQTHNRIKLNYWIYKWAKNKGLTICHDNSYRNQPFYFYTKFNPKSPNNNLVAIALGIKT